MYNCEKGRGKMHKKAKKIKPLTIQITELDGAVKKIGKYFPDKNEFVSERVKSVHFIRKYNAWALDCKVTDFLAEKMAIITIKDKETHWDYQCRAQDLKKGGHVLEYNQHRPQYYMNVEQWDVIKAKGRSFVVECLEKDCRYNFLKCCTRGAIKLSDNGECTSYEDRQD
jgi:hypothetical protein